MDALVKRTDGAFKRKSSLEDRIAKRERPVKEYDLSKK
jgi:hypothetical protein